MHMSLRNRAAVVLATAAVAALVATTTAFAAPVLQPGVTSYPGMSGTCTNCHTYATAAAKPIAKPVARPVVKTAVFSRPFLKKSAYRRSASFRANGYFAPTLASSTNATVTIAVQRRNARGKWVATPSFDETATLSATGKYKNKISYTALMNISRLGHYRLRAKLVYLDASSVSHVKWSTLTVVNIKKR